MAKESVMPAARLIAAGVDRTVLFTDSHNEILNVSVQEKVAGFQAIAMLKDKGCGIVWQFVAYAITA